MFIVSFAELEELTRRITNISSKLSIKRETKGLFSILFESSLILSFRIEKVIDAKQLNIVDLKVIYSESTKLRKEIIKHLIDICL